MTFRDSIISIIKKPKELLTGHITKKEKFLALKDISISIEQGDVVGLIGKNGSGKSTMLKILSKIVEPTDGEIIMRGKSASLLEVGTGFHPELTGRENIYFNGSILGMKKKEIEAKFDEIVKFSGVDKFLDTPVKFYSSGMYVRLAFAVAAHLEPDILIVDEVLAVGDADFQKKSLGKMKDVTQDKSRTVIFVSHNMESIKSICNKCIWINEGQIKAAGPAEKVVEEYMSSSLSSINRPLNKRLDRTGTGKAVFVDCKLTNRIDSEGKIGLIIRINNKVKYSYKGFKLSIDLIDTFRDNLANINNFLISKKLDLKPGINDFRVTINNINLVPGNYYLNLFLASDQYNSEILDWVEEVVEINIKDYDYYKVGSPPGHKGKTLYLDFDINAKK